MSVCVLVYKQHGHIFPALICSAVMDVKVAIVLVCLCALAITTTEAGIPKCCINTRKNITNRLLRKVYHWDRQKSNGACDIPALVLYLNGKRMPVCASPEIETRLMMVWQRKKHIRSRKHTM